MGGDKAPHSVIQGARIALKWFPDLRYVFFGDEALLAPLIQKYKLDDRSRIVHTTNAIAADDKPSIALRQGRESSMRLAIDSVASGENCAMVSAGNTGALMATAKFVFKTLNGIHRPAITATMPARSGNVVMLDMGANIDCTSEYLVQFAMMGDAYARALLDIEEPLVGLLNVGSEDMKGHDEVKEAHRVLKSGQVSVRYHGFVEGNDILDGTVDVVVTDGFTGNIALKTAEGASRLLYSALKTSIESSLLAKIGYLFAKPAIKMAMKKYDPRRHNGAILLGLNGIAVKSHGGADAKAFANAIKVAARLVEQDVNAKIVEELNATGALKKAHTGDIAPVLAESVA